jgi:hypothetical protein
MQLVHGHARRSAALLGLGALLLLVLVGAAGVLVVRGGETFRQVAAERDLRRVAGDLLSALQDVETGQRGYLITLDERFLDPYSRALGQIPALRDELAAQVRRSPEEGDAILGELDPLVDRRLSVAATGVDLARAGRAEEARAVVAQGEGKETMDALRVVLGGLVARSDARLERAIQAQERLNLWTEVASLLAAAALLGAVGWAFDALRRQMHVLRAADGELRRLNAGLEERVQERTEDLMRANAEVQRFAYIVTHDLRAPLVNIMGFTSELEESLKAIQAYVLADGEPLPEHAIREARAAAAEDLPEALGFIRASTRKMDGLISAILKISRDGRRELRPERLDLREVAQGALAAVAHQIAETGGAAVVEAQVAAVVSDRLSLEQALGNLVDNAVKYAAPGRPLRLVVRTRPNGPRRVRIEVEDNGRGIAEADRERVFDLFRRAGRQDRPGEGIGLAHVRTLVRNLGGDVSLRSREGAGSVFALDLPADLREVRRARRGGAPGGGAADGGAAGGGTPGQGTHRDGPGDGVEARAG